MFYKEVIMETQDKESLQKELQELEAKLDEAFDLGLCEFNLSNYMIMLDDEISMLRSQIEAEK